MPGYKVTNVVKSVQTRAHRWNAATTHRSKQIVGAHRILPRQTLEFAEEHYKAHESMILEKVKGGELMVTCPDGTTITSTPAGGLIYRRPEGVVDCGGAPEVVQEEPVSDEVAVVSEEVVEERPEEGVIIPRKVKKGRR